MRPLLFFLCLLFASAELVQAQKASPIRFSTRYHDFGFLYEDSAQVTHRFTFFNQGPTSLRLDTVYSPCDCTHVRWSPEIPPRTEGFVQITLNPTQYTGPLQKSFQLVFGNNLPIITLSIQAHVIPSRDRIRTYFSIRKGKLGLPAQAFYMGRLQKRKPLSRMARMARMSRMSRTFLLYNAGPDTMSLAVPQIPVHLDLHFYPSRLPPQQVGRLHITYDAHKRKGYGYQLDTVPLSMGADIPMQTLYIAAAIEKLPDPHALSHPRLVLTENTYNFGYLRSPRQVFIPFELKNTGSDTLHIQQIRTQCACIRASIEPPQIAPGSTETLMLFFDTRALHGKQRREVIIYSSDPIRPTQVLTLKGRVESP